MRRLIVKIVGVKIVWCLRVGDVSCGCDRQGEVMCVVCVIGRVGDVSCGCDREGR